MTSTSSRHSATVDAPAEPRTSRKRRAILQAATTVFLRKGYVGTSMDEIAALATVSKQTVYKHFADKETLFSELVAERVTRRAGMNDTAFLRSDELPGRAAAGYLSNDSPRTNVFHLPVLGSGDGGIYTTLADVHALWDALFAGVVVAEDVVQEMTRPISTVPPHYAYGLGLWLDPRFDAVLLEGADAGVSFRSIHRRATGTTHTVISNTTDGAWPITELIEDHIRGT